MDLTKLRPIYEHEGPFATTYLEGRTPGEDATEQMRLRSRSLREHLSAAGASASVLEAIESALLGADAGEVQSNGRVLTANKAGVVFDEPWDAAVGAGDAAHWTRLPELGAYVREWARSVRMLVVIADEQHAVIRKDVVAEQHAPRELDAKTVRGDAKEGVHKPRGGALSHNQIQRRAEHAVERNVGDMVSRLRTIAAEFPPQVVALAGEAQARTAIRGELPQELAQLCVEVEHGGNQDEAAEEALAGQLREIASAASARAAQTRTHQLNEGLAHERAVQGDGAVAQAAEMGAVDTLLLEHGTGLDREAFLLKACAETSSQADLVESNTGLVEGVGALLRFPVHS